MKQVAAALLLATLPAFAQQRELAAARAVMESARFCFLITVDESGQPHARLMEALAPDSGLVVWMGTLAGSRKVAQLRRNPRATLAYYDAKGPDYVTLLGKARVVTGVAEKRRHWRPGWEAFFPGGPDGENYVAIEFTPARLELISNTHTIASAPGSTGPLVLERRKEGWVLLPRPGFATPASPVKP